MSHYEPRMSVFWIKVVLILAFVLVVAWIGFLIWLANWYWNRA